MMLSLSACAILVLQTIEDDIHQSSSDLGSLLQMTPGFGPAFHNRTTPLSAKLESLSGLSASYRLRLDSTHAVLEGMDLCSTAMANVEKRLAALETVTTDRNKLHEVTQDTKVCTILITQSMCL